MANKGQGYEIQLSITIKDANGKCQVNLYTNKTVIIQHTITHNELLVKNFKITTSQPEIVERQHI